MADGRTGDNEGVVLRNAPVGAKEVACQRFTVYRYEPPFLTESPVRCAGRLRPCLWTINPDRSVTMDDPSDRSLSTTRFLSSIVDVWVDRNSPSLLRVQFESDPLDFMAIPIYFTEERERLIQAMAIKERKLTREYLARRTLSLSPLMAQIREHTMKKEESRKQLLSITTAEDVPSKASPGTSPRLTTRAEPPVATPLSSPSAPYKDTPDIDLVRDANNNVVIIVQGYLEKPIRSKSFFAKAFSTKEHRRWFRLHQAKSGQGGLLQWSDEENGPKWKSVVVTGLDPVGNDPLQLQFRTAAAPDPIFTVRAATVKDAFIWRTSCTVLNKKQPA